MPVGGGLNTRRAIKLAVSMAKYAEQPAKVVLLHVMPPGMGPAGDVRAERNFHEQMEGVEYPNIEKIIVKSTKVADAILDFAKAKDDRPKSDLIVIGATNEPLFKRLLIGNISEKIAREADVTTIVVKRRNSPLHSFLRQTVLEPTSSNGQHNGA